jgi:hypothetical protein
MRGILRRSAMSSPSLIPLDPQSESILNWERPGFSQTDFVGFTLRGRIDADAMRAAVVAVQETRPHFHARLAALRSGLRHAWVWRLCGAPVGLDVTDVPDAPPDVDAFLHERLRDETNRVKDLACEPPVAFRLFRFPGDVAAIVLSFHHVAADGAGVWECFRDLLAAYHVRVTGETPPWAAVPAFHSLLGETTSVETPPLREFVRRMRAERKAFPNREIAQVMGTARRTGNGAPGRLMIRRTVDDPNLLAALRARARREGGTLTDLFVAGSMKALEEWNGARGKVPTAMVHALAVNQRRRTKAGGGFQGNPMSMVTVPSREGDRRTPDAALAHAVKTRAGKLAAGHDVALIRLAESMRAPMSYIPPRARGALTRSLVVRPLSLFITNPGILWPVVVGGRPTGETAITRIGGADVVGAEVAAFHLSVGGTEANPLAMILTTFRGTLHVDCTVGRHRLREDEARGYLDLVLRRVFDYA